MFINETPQEGLTLFGPIGALATHLINNDSLVVNSWDTAYRPAMMGYLLDSGHLLRTARLWSVSENFAGAECAIGDTGGHLWSGVPEASLFFMVVGTDAMAIYESSWGRNTNADERHGTKASFLCGSTTKVVTSTCP